MKYVLRRLNITGPLNETTTPIEVIDQCMTSHGLEPVWERLRDATDVRYRKKCISRLMEVPPVVITIDTPPSRRELGKAVRYINCKTVFSDVGKIEMCLRRLSEWETDVEMPEEGVSGPLTELDPGSLDCTMIYRLCVRRGLKTRPEHTVEEMRWLLTMSRVHPERLRDLVVEKVGGMSSVEVINLFERHIPRKFDFTRASFYELHSPRDDVVFPRTEHEAVILAARNFRLNITDSRDTFSEYSSLLRGGDLLDPRLRGKMDVDPYALRTDQRFFPELPEYAYYPETLRRLAVEEGWYSEEDSGTCYKFLRRVYFEKTFFAFGRGPMAGVVPENESLKIELTSYMDEDPLNLVLWGCRTEPQRMTCFTWGELLMTFEAYGDFRVPVETSRVFFEPSSIRKLVILARKPCINKIIADRMRRLVMVIEKIILSNNSYMETMRITRGRLNEIPEFKNQFRELLDMLYRVSLEMRGGAGGLDTGDLETVSTNVELELVELQALVDRVGEEVRRMFLGLPIVIYSHGKFSRCEERFEGYTIGGRLKIVYEGESTSAMSSCLRLSSNWFLSTVYYYQTEFGLPTCFDITALVHVG